MASWDRGGGIGGGRRGVVYFANESATNKPVDLFLANQLTPAEAGKDHWVQLSPFGDFANGNGKTRVIQRLKKEDATTICNSFNSALRRVTQPLGMPFYIGHPDHPRFKGQPGHSDTRSYGRGKEMAVRADDHCAACKAFANAESDAAPCQEHGLFVRMQWNDDGKHLLSNESFHGHSVNWAAVPEKMENGVQVFRPIHVKSTGFTNEPNIPVRPASLANAAASDEEEAPAQDIVPPALKLVAGFKADQDVTMAQVIAALQKARVTDPSEAQKANERVDGLAGALGELLLANADAVAPSDDDPDKKTFLASLHELLGTDPATGKEGIKAALADKVAKAGIVEKVKESRKNLDKAMQKHHAARNDLETQLANERKARATLIVDGLVKSGKVVTKDRETRITELCNVAADQFDGEVEKLANAGRVIKTDAKSTGLANQHAAAVEGERARTARLQELMDKREKEFQNEGYEDRFRAVANSTEGVQLFTQMRRAGEEQL